LQFKHLAVLLSPKEPFGQLKGSKQEKVCVKKNPELQIAHSETCLHCAQLFIAGHFSQILVVISAYVFTGHYLAKTQPKSIDI
jgi:hypothetical protein